MTGPSTVGTSTLAPSAASLDADGQVQLDVVAVAAQVRIGPDLDLEVEIAGRAALAAARARPARDAQAAAALDAGRDRDLDGRCRCRCGTLRRVPSAASAKPTVSCPTMSAPRLWRVARAAPTGRRRAAAAAAAEQAGEDVAEVDVAAELIPPLPAAPAAEGLREGIGVEPLGHAVRADRARA